MSVSETFDRKFNKSMRGYNTEEVDAALDALLRYCDELEDANREFEIANNDLIDDKTDLNKKIGALTAEKEALEGKLAEMSERVAHVEGLYNSYREKFGEARDMITKAKSSSAEIIARAQAKAEIIAEEAAEKHRKDLEEFDKETEKRRLLIEKLDKCFNDFNGALKCELQAMLDRVDSFAVSPALPSGLPERRSILSASDLFAENDENDENGDGANSDIIIAVNTDNTDGDDEEETETVTDPEMTPYDLDGGDEDEGDGDTAASAESVSSSKMSEMKSSLDVINQKVLKKKSTPHI